MPDCDIRPTQYEEGTPQHFPTHLHVILTNLGVHVQVDGCSCYYHLGVGGNVHIPRFCMRTRVRRSGKKMTRGVGKSPIRSTRRHNLSNRGEIDVLMQRCDRDRG